MKPVHLKIASVLTVAMITVISSSVRAGISVEQRVDSLFIIASSLDIKYRDQVEPARDSIAALGATAVPRLIEMLGTPYGYERVALEEIFKKIGAPATPLLNAALLTTDSLQLSRVALILSYLPDSSSVKNLLRVVDDKYYWVRYQTLRALAQIGDKRAASVVRRALKDDNELVRTMAAVAAGRLKDKELLTDLVKTLDDPYYGVRMAAHEELKNADCASKQALILASLTLPSTTIRKQLLGIIAEDTCGYDLSTVRLYLADVDPVAQSLALRAAYRIDSAFVIDYLSDRPDTSASFLLRQTIEDLRTHHEAQTPANP